MLLTLPHASKHLNCIISEVEIMFMCDSLVCVLYLRYQMYEHTEVFTHIVAFMFSLW